jgi:hypothetical protein
MSLHNWSYAKGLMDDRKILKDINYLRKLGASPVGWRQRRKSMRDRRAGLLRGVAVALIGAGCQPLPELDGG